MRILLVIATILLFTTAFSQMSDSTHKADTLALGRVMLIKKNRYTDSSDHSITIKKDYFFIWDKRKKKQSIISTKWWMMDLGFANFRDNTNYTSAQSMGYCKTVNGVPISANSFGLNTGKSANLNIWFFMQKMNLSKHVLNLKYGMGLEMYNFRYDHSLSYRNNPAPIVFNDTIGFKKNKLYLGYLTVPMMLNLNATPHRKNGCMVSAGISAGYLLGAHDKEMCAERGKQKYHGDLGLQPWRLAGISELGLGPVRLYGSYSLNALHKASTGLDQFPYVVGIRFSKW